MKKRKLGNTDLVVNPLCLGANVFGWTINEKSSFEILDVFFASGYNFIDTADVYSRWASGIGGESETIIGKWMKQIKNRDKMIIATKVGMDMGEGPNISKKYILKMVDNSLRRLQTDYIDLYQTHVDDNITPVEETLEAYHELVKAGKVRWIGASNLSPKKLQDFLEASAKNNFPRYETFQPLYNLYDREVFEKELEPICHENNVSVINYYSLAAGFLTGKYRSEADLSKSVRGAKAKNYLNERGLSILKVLDEVAKEYETTCGNIAIAWLNSKPSIGAPIASATSIAQLKDILFASRLQLKPETLKKLDEVSEWK